MLIAVSSDSNNGMDAGIHQHFGRCPFYTFIEVEEGAVKNTFVEENPYFNAHSPGQVPAYINSKNADVMIAGGMGARAVQFFEQYGIKPVTGVSGTVRNAVDAFLAGDADGVEPCSHGHKH